MGALTYQAVVPPSFLANELFLKCRPVRCLPGKPPKPTPHCFAVLTLLFLQIMYDTNNLDSEYCCETPAEQQWVEQFQTSTLSLIGALPPTVPIFSSVCLVHCLSCNADFWTFTADGRSLAQAMNEWYFQGQGAVQSSIVGHCTGWNCTLQCSGGPVSAFRELGDVCLC